MSRITIALLIISILCPFSAACQPNDTESASGYVTMVDQQGAVVFETGLPVNPGDEYINEDNRVYEVTAVDGALARARYVRDEALLFEADEAVPAQAPPAEAPPPPPQASPLRVALYYTHSDESYIPTDGDATIMGNGGIYKVGAAFADRLTSLGVQVDNDQTRHDPHDANAYQRSRRTFKRLLEGAPDILFDLHRDSAPLSAYQTTIDGEPAAKMMLVVGRQNQNRNTTMNYAKKIKAICDSRYRGLIRGIFIAHGNYNQDLSPRAMLVEIGTQYISRQAAERSAVLFADLVPAFLDSAPAAQDNKATWMLPLSLHGAGGPETPGVGRDIAAIIGVLLAGVAGYFLISTGGWQETKRRLKRFRKYEFMNLLAPWRKRK